jgi:putative membrane protein
MKKLSYLSIIAAAAFVLQSCSNTPKDAKQNADSLNKTKDTTQNATATGGIAVTNDDAKFATAAANGGMAEVAMGKLALERATNIDVKAFANMMVIDHGKANEELMDIAKTKNITLPAAVDADHKKKLDELSKLRNADFDKTYVNDMIEGHKKVLDLMQAEAKDGKDAELKAFATKMVPAVKMHLEHITTIHDNMK